MQLLQSKMLSSFQLTRHNLLKNLSTDSNILTKHKAQVLGSEGYFKWTAKYSDVSFKETVYKINQQLVKWTDEHNNGIKIPTSQRCGILSSFSLIPGIKTMQEAIKPKRRNKEYTILVDVEFLHVGQALQHKPQAALPQQQAMFAAQVAAEQTPKTAPML